MDHFEDIDVDEVRCRIAAAERLARIEGRTAELEEQRLQEELRRFQNEELPELITDFVGAIRRIRPPARLKGTLREFHEGPPVWLLCRIVRMTTASGEDFETHDAYYVDERGGVFTKGVRRTFWGGMTECLERVPIDSLARRLGRYAEARDLMAESLRSVPG